MKKQNIIIIAVFGLLIVSLGLLSWLTPDAEFSENENRVLQQLPRLTADTVKSGDFGDEVEDYLSDQFFQRDRWTAIRSRAKMLLLNRDIGGVYLADDGYYIEKVTPNDLDGERLAQNLQTLRQFFDRCAESGMAAENMTFLPVPTPGSILRDKLPKYATLFDEDAVFAQMQAALEGYRLLDLREPFAAAAGERQLYYRTDHHWTTAGALLGYQCYRAALGLPAPNEADFTVEEHQGFRGTLYSKVLDANAATDTVMLYRQPGDTAWSVWYDNTDHAGCYDTAKLAQKDMYEVFFGGNWPTVTIRGGAENGRRLLVLKDSYANAFLPFAAADYEEIVAVDLRYYLGSLSELMQQEGITDLLVLYSTSSFIADPKIDRLALG